MKNVIGILIGIALNLYITLDSLKILTVLILPIHEHKEFIHLFVSFSISFLNASQFSVHRSFTILFKFIAKYFTFSFIINEIVFLVSLTAHC